MSDRRGTGIIRIAQELLFEMMGFPRGTKVEGWYVSESDFQRNTLLLKVSHRKLKAVPPGHLAPILDAKFEKDGKGNIKLTDWGEP